MADINARLLQAIDGSAPQHKVRGQNRFELEVYNGSTFTPYRLPISPTSTRTAITPDRTKYTSFFEEIEENVVILTKQLELRGVRVVLVNALEEDEDITVTITYSEVDES